jgi:hypothetical protein
MPPWIRSLMIESSSAEESFSSDRTSNSCTGSQSGTKQGANSNSFSKLFTSKFSRNWQSASLYKPQTNPPNIKRSTLYGSVAQSEECTTNQLTKHITRQTVDARTARLTNNHRTKRVPLQQSGGRVRHAHCLTSSPQRSGKYGRFLDFTARDIPIGNDIAEQGSCPDLPLKNPLAFELVGQRRGEAVLIHCICYQLFHALFQIMAPGL